MAVVLALAASALWGSADFGGGLLSRRLSPLAVVFLSQLVALFGIIGLLFATGHEPLVGNYLWYAAASGVVGPLALFALYRALSIGPMGLVAPIAATGVLIPVFVGMVQGERPSTVQFAGVALAVIGVVLASGPELGGAARGHRRLGLLLAAAAAVGFGALFALIARSAEGDLATALLVQRTINVMLGVLLVALVVRAAPRPARKDLPLLVFVGLADVAANAAFALASRSGLVSVVAVLASLYPVVTVLLARQLLGERLRGVQRAGTVVALGGVVLLAAG